MNERTRFAAMLASEFQVYRLEHGALAVKIPPSALVVFRVEGEDDFNEWHRRLSLRNREPGQPVVTIAVRTWRKHSLIADLDMVPA